MFLHQFKYALLSALRKKDILFWTLLFPIALSTFMNMAFGNLYEKDEVFHPINVALVENQENKSFSELVEELSEKGDSQLFNLILVEDENEAKKKLKDEKIDGYYVLDDEIELVVSKSNLNQTILDMVLTQFEQTSQVAEACIALNYNNSEKIQEIVETLTVEKDYITVTKTSSGNQNVYVNYFYAVFAMSCLFASFTGVEKAVSMQADTSALGMRQSLLPATKGILVASEFFSALLLQFVFEIIAFCYMKFVLGIDFGEKYIAIFLLLLTGCSCGIGLGMIIGSIHSMQKTTKVGMATGIAMLLSVCADLVANGIKDIIEHTCPIINRINPAALIVDSFYSLNVYDNYDRFLKNILSLFIITLVLLFVSFLLVRRNSYESL